MLEIERKYLVQDDSWRELILKSEEIRQGYFKSNDATIRLRISDDVAFLTIKSRPLPDSFTRHEFEYEIPVEDAEQMLKEFCADRIIEKTRHHMTCCGSHWIVDEFKARHDGLVLAEIELDAEDEEFEIPEWVGKEVTTHAEYTNGSLAENGLPKKKKK